MAFDDWLIQDYTPNINPALLWDYDIDNFDWENGKTIVVQRVIERGQREDFYIAIRKYGGLKNFIEIIKTIPYLNDVDMNYVSKIFKIPLNELQCYKNKQHRQQLLDSWNR